MSEKIEWPAEMRIRSKCRRYSIRWGMHDFKVLDEADNILDVAVSLSQAMERCQLYHDLPQDQKEALL